MNTRPLAKDLLDELGARWEARSLPLLDLLQPGLSDRQISEVEASLGLRLPTEARLWWSWHDGVPATAVRFGRERSFGPGFEYLPLSEAVQLYGKQRELSVEAAEGNDPPMDDPHYWWAPSWFPITRSGSGEVVVVDCNAAPGEPTPVRLIDWWLEDFHEVRTASLREVVAEWIDAFDTGRWRWVNEGGGRWERELLPGFQLS